MAQIPNANICARSGIQTPDPDSQTSRSDLVTDKLLASGGWKTPLSPLVNGHFMYAPENRSIAIYDLADFFPEYKNSKL